MDSLYFKPEFSGNSEGDLEAHLLRNMDWKDIHIFAKHQQVRRFPLTLVGKAKLWYQSMHPYQGEN